LIILILSTLSFNVSSLNNAENKIIDKVIREIEISPGSDYVIKYSSDNFSFDELSEKPYTVGLSDKIKNAIAKSPKWIQRELTRQFLEIDGDIYADLILESSKKYTDEIAFSIASSVIGQVPPVDILMDNILTLYENDKFLKYADIIDYNNYDGNYFSTVRYWVIENDDVKELEFPPDIYYWYIVHPCLTGEKPAYIYDSLWREYLFNHNDLGYPLLKEKLSEIQYLWDCESYFQAKDRTWDWSIKNHPTAVEAVSYWVGKTVPEWAFGDRPTQPNIIAHQHNGWCGELQKIAVAALRASLIPSVAVSNRGEDHVWREFYERGWHENDNWWADGGGAVDEPDIYAYGWNKDMSAIHQTRGDSVIEDVTPTYIHSKERKTITFKVLDRSLSPVDGARVTAAVTGPYDITWLRNELNVILEKIWDFMPDILKGRILQYLYDKAKQRIDEIEDTIDAPIYSIWKYTDENGLCSLELGQNISYTFFIQYENLKKPLIPARFNRVRSLENPVDKDYVIWFPLLSSEKIKLSNSKIPNGDVHFEISFDSYSYQLQNSILGNQNKGVYEGSGKIDFFIVDQENYNKYLQGERFDCHNFISDDSQALSISAPNSDWYMVFRNSCRESNMILHLTASMITSIPESRVSICTPHTSIFENPIINTGEKVLISGIATEDIDLEINGDIFGIITKLYNWNYSWDTYGLSPGEYTIKANCLGAHDELTIKLVDYFPPEIIIENPVDHTIVQGDSITISGVSTDNFGVESVEVKIDNSDYMYAVGTNLWSIDWNINDLGIGNHLITVKCIDKNGCVSYDEKTFVLNESGHTWGPIINSFYNKPEQINNQSNVIIFADLSCSSPFGLKSVAVKWNDGFESYSKNMFRYADNPVQDRHEEDILKDQPNDPIFGLELGQFYSGSIIFYHIEAVDYANNVAISDENSFIID
jgi:hypothetical protein